MCLVQAKRRCVTLVNRKCISVKLKQLVNAKRLMIVENDAANGRIHGLVKPGFHYPS